MKPDLAQLLATWQAKLRLQDWRIAISYVPDLAMRDGTPVWGLCTPLLHPKEARIQIRDPELSRPIGEQMPVEETVVHELLHLHLAPLSEETPAGIAAEEQAVWAITEAMVSTKDAAQRAQLARAFISVAGRRHHERRQEMDPQAILAMLKMALTSDDPKAALETLIAQLEGSSGAPAAEPDAAAAQAGAPPAEEPKAATAAPPAEEPKAQRVAPRAVVPASTLASRGQVADLESRINARFEQERIERLVDKRPDLSAAQRAHAISLPTAKLVEGFLAITPAGGAQPAAKQRAQVGTAPTAGARAHQVAIDPQDAEIDRRMGIREPMAQAISVDPVTGRMSISSLAPLRVQKVGDAS